MISKSEIKLIQSLRLKKFRQKYDLFIAEGDKTVRTLLSHQRFQLHQLYTISEKVDISDMRVNPRNITICTKKELNKLSSLQSTPSILASFKIGEAASGGDKAFPKEIYLDDIQDPGNLGAIIRIADWFGIDRESRSEGSADFYNAKVVQATMGSLGHVFLKTLAKEDFQTHFEQHYKIGASMINSGTSKTKSRNVCLVVGNEGKGISDEIQELLDCQVHIPGSPNKAADSLNASVATGILCQEIFGSEIN